MNITNQRQLRRLFWATFPELSRRKIMNFNGHSKMWTTDTRRAFVDWIDALQKSGQISERLAGRATL